VIDMSRVLAGPFCGQMLADMGADVIKIEPPGGDENRTWPPLTEDGQSCNFMSVNRGKRSLTLDMKSDVDKANFRKLLRTADVLIHNYLPAIAEKVGVAFEMLHADFPDLIVCSISSYGNQGALRNNPGFDALLSAFSGIMSLTGEPDRPPVRTGVSTIDLGTGIYGYSGILTALLARPQMGGQHVQVSLLETAISFLTFNGVGWLEAGTIPRREGSGIWYSVPYQLFHCSDGDLYVGALNDMHFRALCETVGRPDLALDKTLATSLQRLARRVELIDIFAGIFAARPVQEWMDRLDSVGVPVSPVHTIDQTLQHKQIHANDMVVGIDRADGPPRHLMGLPFKLGDIRMPVPRVPPDAGEQTAEILAELEAIDPKFSSATPKQPGTTP